MQQYCVSSTQLRHIPLFVVNWSVLCKDEKSFAKRRLRTKDYSDAVSFQKRLLLTERLTKEFPSPGKNLRDTSTPSILECRLLMFLVPYAKQKREMSSERDQSRQRASERTPIPRRHATKAAHFHLRERENIAQKASCWSTKAIARELGRSRTQIESFLRDQSNYNRKNGDERSSKLSEAENGTIAREACKGELEFSGIVKALQLNVKSWQVRKVLQTAAHLRFKRIARSPTMRDTHKKFRFAWAT